MSMVMSLKNDIKIDNWNCRDNWITDDVMDSIQRQTI